MNAARALWQSLWALKGNQRALIMTEPLWAVPYNLFLPFASMYMAAIGLNVTEIGLVASLGLASEFLWGLLSGAVVDKYGRRASMLLFGLLSWTLPCALWALAREPWHFALAALLNGMWRVMGNGFSCMIVEGEDRERLIHVYTILNIIGILAGFLSPLVGLMIGRFTLVSAMRAMYAAAMILMTAKFFALYRLSQERPIGYHRVEECVGQPLIRLAFSGWPAFRAALHVKRMRLLVILMVLMTCFGTIQANFWPLFVTREFLVSDSGMSVFPLVKSAITLLVFFTITPRIHLTRVQSPLVLGLTAQGLGLVALVAFRPMAGAAIFPVFFSAACDAFALAVLGPLTESMMSVTIPGAERARINSLIFASILLVSTPAGFIAGQLAARSRVLPLIMNLALVAAEIIVALGISREGKGAPSVE
jgi:MFS family permease